MSLNYNIMKTKIFLYIIISLLITKFPAYAQMGDETYCSEEGSSPSGPPYEIPHLTPVQGEALRVAIIYVTFPDDDDRGFDYTVWPRPTLTNPPAPTQPSIPLIVPTEGSNTKPSIERYSAYTLSDFFCETSLGKFDVIGEEYKVMLPSPSTFYQNAHTLVGELNNIVLGLADSQIDYSDYDNWRLNGGQWEQVPDGVAEMIVIMYRNVPNNSNAWFYQNTGAGGSATLRTNTVLDGIIIFAGSGVTTIGQLYNASHTLQIMEHEISHRWFGHHNIGFMPAAHTQSSYCYIPMERERVGYIDNVNNITTVTSNATVTLRDFIEFGDVVKVPIPGTNDFYYLANHQKHSEYDGVSKGGKECYETNFTLQDPPCASGTGLFFYTDDVNCSNYNQPWDVVSAEGKYGWAIDRLVNIPPQPAHFLTNGLANYPLMETTTGDRINGRDEYRKAPDGSAPSVVSDNPCSYIAQDFWVTWDEKGNGFDAFKMGYDEIFSPYSNPSTKNCNNSTNNGLTFRIIDEDTKTGEMRVEIYYNDDVNAYTTMPPSKPKNLKIQKDYIVPGKFNPKLTWDANIEPDFTRNGIYKILRGATVDCEQEPSQYTLITTLGPSVTELIDQSVDLYDVGSGSGICEYGFITYHYKIIATDNTSNESLPSEKSVVFGYQDPCAPEDNIPGFEIETETPDDYSVKQNYPNPFNPSTNIQFNIPVRSFVSLKIYDVSGKEVAVLVDGYKEAGSYIAAFNGSNLSSGIYYYKLKAGNFEATRRMVLIK